MRAKRLEQIGLAYFDPKKPIEIRGGRGNSFNVFIC
jgi:hypothetical protein